MLFISKIGTVSFQELALSTIPGARVCAGTLSKVMDSNLPASNAHLDSDFLPDLDTSDGSCPETDVEPEGTKRKRKGTKNNRKKREKCFEKQLQMETITNVLREKLVIVACIEWLMR